MIQITVKNSKTGSQYICKSASKTVKYIAYKHIKMYHNTPELIKFVREHANDYDTLKRNDVPSCITIDRRRNERYFYVYIEKFGNVRFDEVLRVFPLLPKSYLNE